MPKSATSAWPSAEQDVLGLDVAVDHAVAVGVVQRVGHLAGDPHARPRPASCLSRPSRSRRLSPSTNGMVNQSRPVGVARVVAREDVRVLQAGGELDLAQEPLGAERGRELGCSTLSATGRSCRRSLAR